MTPRFSRSELVWLPLVLLGVLAIYLPGLGNQPVFDDALLTDGVLFEQYRSLRELRTRLFSYGSFVWLQALFGEGWWKQRVANLAIHVGVVLALWGFYREVLRHIEVTRDELAAPGVPAVTYDRSPALGLAIAVFALNPVAVYAVAYLIQRSILLATLFVVLGLWLFARAVARRKPMLYLLAAACYLLALLSKEHAILAPLAALPVYIVVARPGGKRLALVFAGVVALVAAAGVMLSMRYGEVLGKPFDEYSRVYLAQLSRLSPDAAKNAFPLSILNQAWLFFEYGVRWVLPYAGWMSINMRPPFPVTWATFPQVLGIAGYLAVVAGGFFLVIRYRDWRELAGLALLLPALLFATEFATVWVQDPFVLYRSYLWAIGIPGLVFIAVHGSSPRALAAVALVVATLFIWQALDRVLSLETPHEAWTDAIVKLPRDPRSVGRWFPYLNRGGAYVESNQFSLAMRDFDTSAALGDMGMGALSLGSLLSASGRHQQALAAFDRAEKEGYDLYNLPFQRALALIATGRLPEARTQLEKTWALKPPSPTRELTLLHLARIELQVGRAGEAIRILRELVAIDPANREGRFLLGMAFNAIHDPGHAFEVLDKLVAEDPRGPTYYARALANYGLKRKAEALADIEAAIRLGPDNPNLHEWQAKIRAMP